MTEDEAKVDRLSNISKDICKKIFTICYDTFDEKIEYILGDEDFKYLSNASKLVISEAILLGFASYVSMVIDTLEKTIGTEKQYFMDQFYERIQEISKLATESNKCPANCENGRYVKEGIIGYFTCETCKGHGVIK